MNKEAILFAVRDADEHELAEAMAVMLAEDWITNPVLIAKIMQCATEALVAMAVRDD